MFWRLRCSRCSGRGARLDPSIPRSPGDPRVAAARRARRALPGLCCVASRVGTGLAARAPGVGLSEFSESAETARRVG